MDIDGSLNRGQQAPMAVYNDSFFVPRQFVMGSHTESYPTMQSNAANMYGMEQGAVYNQEPPPKHNRTMIPVTSPPVTPQPSSHYEYHSNSTNSTNQSENYAVNTPVRPVKLFDEFDQPVKEKINLIEQGWICRTCHSMFTVKDYLIQHIEAIHKKGSNSQNTDTQAVSNGTSNPFCNLFKATEARNQTQGNSKFPNLLSTQEVGLVTKNQAADMVPNIKREINNDFEYLDKKELDNIESGFNQNEEKEEKVNPQDVKGNIQTDQGPEPGNLNWICAKCHLLFNTKYLVTKHMEDRHGFSDVEITDSCDGFMCGVCNLVVKLRSSVREHLRKKHSCKTITSTNVFKVIMPDRKTSPPSDIVKAVKRPATRSVSITPEKRPTQQKVERDDKLDMYQKQLTEQQGFPSLRMLSCWALHCEGAQAPNNDTVASLVKLRKYKSANKVRGRSKGYICPLACGYNSSSFQTIILHQLSCLQNGFGYRRWICYMCKSTFESRENLVHHHETMCPFPFNNKPADEEENPESTNDESSSCEVCMKKFANLQKMKLHVKIKHTFNIFYTCQICWKSLEQNKKKENMLEHLWKFHKVKQIWTDLVSLDCLEYCVCMYGVKKES